MNWTLPNILTVLRLLAAPGLAVMFLYFSRPLADWFALVLFLGAAITDFIDGYLARAWKQETKLGAMLDPIADKAMVVIALLVIVSQSGLSPWLMLPATVILFREIFVSGLREFLGAKAGLLKVTRMAKWKTTAQMVAIAVLFSTGIFEHYFVAAVRGLEGPAIDAILAGEAAVGQGIRLRYNLMTMSQIAGIALLAVAALLTLITGWDYFRKALPYLKDDPR
ncbi:CDP-diacylglycerol--glycerol-3-phosphate 3-phosphatidyltransferase [Halodurantibacterium flavum]|uniref:CDP-diacylglycerol--glycerol-3-phosphate 3-phosphatidyltransferase n=1 Tax=Halodurantibacterium flavum TaxID=1382802 RepID=A0ABW4S5P6_9RHOB